VGGMENKPGGQMLRRSVLLVAKLRFVNRSRRLLWMLCIETKGMQNAEQGIQKAEGKNDRGRTVLAF